MISNKEKTVFLALVLFQGLHSLEEYYGKIWENFPPATMLCGLVSSDLVTGFLVINIGLFVFGLLCWIFPVRNDHFYAPVVIWFWIAIELINGIGHPFWSIYQGTYATGTTTAPFLLLLAIYLLRVRLKS